MGRLAISTLQAGGKDRRMTRADNGRLKFGVGEWVAIVAVVVGPMMTYGSWLWQQSDRVLVLEQVIAQHRESLGKIEAQTELIPRIDQRVLAIEATLERRPVRN